MLHDRYRPKNPEKEKFVYRYLLFVRGSQRQRNLLKTTKRSLKSFNNSVVIDANIIILLLMNLYL